MSTQKSQLEDEAKRLLEEKLRDLEQANECCRENVSRRRLIITEYCDNLRSQVDLVTQSAIERLNKQNQEMMDEIGVYERELLDLLEFKDGEKIRPEDDLDKQMVAKNDQLIERIKSNSDAGQALNQVDMEDRISLLKAMTCQLEEQDESFDQRLFAKRFLHFVENEKFFNVSRNVGRLEKFSHSRVVKRKRQNPSLPKNIS